MTVKISVDTSVADQGLEKLASKLQNLKPAFKGIGDYMTRAILRRFESGVDSKGKAWAPLSAATISHKRNPKILQESERLKNSISYEATNSQLEIGTEDGIAYDAIHQFGGQAGRNRKVRIPARPYLGVSQSDESAITDIIQRYLQEDK
jgi:phage virion morphogenesis protein